MLRILGWYVERNTIQQSINYEYVTPYILYIIYIYISRRNWKCIAAVGCLYMDMSLDFGRVYMNGECFQ